MKFLIDNYATYGSSQAIYFSHHINNTDEHESIFLAEQRASLFDTFDKASPDFYITSAEKLSQDAVLYLSENKNLKLLLSVANVSNREVLEIETILLNTGVSCPFFFSNLGNEDMPFTKKIKTIRIMEAYDENFEIKKPDIKFHVDKCIIVNGRSSEIRNYDSTFHVVATEKDLAKDADFCLPINWLSQIIDNYNEIIFNNISNSLPQIFFQSIALGKKVFYDIKDSDSSSRADTMVNGIFGVGDALNYKNLNKMEDFSELQKIVLEKHSSSRRTKSLLSQIPKK